MRPRAARGALFAAIHPAAGPAPRLQHPHASPRHPGPEAFAANAIAFDNTRRLHTSPRSEPGAIRHAGDARIFTSRNSAPAIPPARDFQPGSLPLRHGNPKKAVAIPQDIHRNHANPRTGESNTDPAPAEETARHPGTGKHA